VCDADVLFGQQGDFVFIQRHAVRQQNPFRLQQAQAFQCADGAAAKAFHRLADFCFGFVGVGMQAGTVALAHGHGPRAGLGRGVVHVLQPDPNIDAAIGLAVPLLDQRFVVIQRIEVIVAFSLTDIGHHDHAVAKRFSGAR